MVKLEERRQVAMRVWVLEIYVGKRVTGRHEFEDYEAAVMWMIGSRPVGDVWELVVEWGGCCIR